MCTRKLLSVGLLALPLSFIAADSAAQDTVRVFLLAGQSNMQGHGRLETGVGGVVGEVGSLRYMVNNDPANYGHLGDGAGTWNTRSDVWVWNRNGVELTHTSGDLGVQYGVDAARFGPELGFGHAVGDAFDDQVVLVKTAWGGKSLAVDFRPPTAVADRGGSVGYYYNLILSSYQEALVDIQAQFPGDNIELTGIGWHQGWNDRVNQAHNDEYEANLADLIVDLRNDLAGGSEVPFVLATTGMSGWAETHPRALSLMDAQLAMNDAGTYPEFEGNVFAVETRDFWRDSAVSPVNQSYHWNQNGETYYLIGDSMGDAMVGLVPEPGSLGLLALGGLGLIRRRRA